MAIQIPQVTKVLNSSTLNTGGTASYNTTAWDFAGYDGVMFIVALGSIAAGGGFSVLKLTESETSGGVYTDVTTTTSGLTIADTDDNKLVAIVVKRTGRKRFQRMTLTTAGAVATVVDSVIAVGLNGNVNDPITVADFAVLTA